MAENTIHMRDNGQIIIQDTQNGNITIDPGKVEESLQQLAGLNHIQLSVLKQLIDTKKDIVNHTFTTLLNNMVKEKNIIKGNISKVKSFKIGDELHYHYHYPIQPEPLPKELSARVPKISKNKIIGRDAELTDLHQRLFNNKQVVLVNGLGGIGKTTLAQVYLAQYWEQYCHIVWVSQISPNIIEDFISTEGLLKNLHLNDEGKDQRALFIDIISAFKKIQDGPNLLVLDNGDHNLAKLYDFLPSQPKWHILATSREEIAKFDLKELDFLSEDEAVSLFLSHYTRSKINRAEIENLVKAVDFHTLTIEFWQKQPNYNALPSPP